MKFEEEFPELRTFKNHYMANSIQMYCVSKQRIINAINKIRDIVIRDIKSNNGNVRQIRICDLIEKELNLNTSNKKKEIAK